MARIRKNYRFFTNLQRVTNYKIHRTVSAIYTLFTERFTLKWFTHYYARRTGLAHSGWVCTENVVCADLCSDVRGFYMFRSRFKFMFRLCGAFKLVGSGRKLKGSQKQVRNRAEFKAKSGNWKGFTGSSANGVGSSIEGGGESLEKIRQKKVLRKKISRKDWLPRKSFWLRFQ